MYVIQLLNHYGKTRAVLAQDRADADSKIYQLRLHGKIHTSTLVYVARCQITDEYTVTTPEIPWEENIWTHL